MSGVPAPLDFLEAVTGFSRAESRSSADKPVRLATVDPAYAGAPALARVTFDGETALSTKAYPFSYPVLAGDRVALLPVGNTYLIIGALGGPAAGQTVPYGGTGRTAVTAGNYLRGAGTAALEERTTAQVRTDIGAHDSGNQSTGNLPVARLQQSIVTGTVNITPSGANVPTTVTWTYGRTLSGTVRAFTTANTTVPGTTVTGYSCTTPSATAVAIYLTRTNVSLTIMYCLAMGGWG